MPTIKLRKSKKTFNHPVVIFTLTLLFYTFFIIRSCSCYPLILLAPSYSNSLTLQLSHFYCGVTAAIRARTLIASKVKQSPTLFLYYIKNKPNRFLNLLGWDGHKIVVFKSDFIYFLIN